MWKMSCPSIQAKILSRVLSLYPCQKKSFYRFDGKLFHQRVNGLRKDFGSRKHFVRCPHRTKSPIRFSYKVL